MSGAAVRTVAVLGDGVAAWSAAAAFARRLPGVAVTVVRPAGYVPMLADMVGGATPSIGDFHDDIAVDGDDLVRRTGATFRLGSRYAAFGSAGPWWHCFGTHGAPLFGAAFHQHFLGSSGAGSFADYSVAAGMAAAGRFTRPSLDPASPLAGFAPGMQLVPAAYAAYLRAHAVRAGAAVVTGAPTPAIDGVTGQVTLHVAGVPVDADLIVDTIGMVADARDGRRIDWSHWLPCDRVVVGAAAPDPALPAYDSIAATASGWRAEASARTHRTLTAAGVGDAGGTFDAVLSRRFVQGRRAAAWTGNVVAIGEAAVVLEPLASVSIHLAHAHIDRIIACLPGRDFAAVEIADYNRQTADEADRLRDFTLLHYATSDRPEPRWRDIAASVLPPALDHDLKLFRARGRLPVHDGESFTLDSWLAVLIGQGVVPQRLDPLAANAPRAGVAAALAAMRSDCAAAAARAPMHRDYLARLTEPRP